MRAASAATAFVLEENEPRILYSADLSPAVLAGAMHTLGHDAALQQHTSQGAAPAVQQIAFVDLSLPDAASLVADLQAQQAQGRPIEVVTIAADQDGLAVIGNTLAAQAEGSVSAVHVLSHGSAGELQLGEATLDAQSLLQRAGAVAGWSKALGAQADLLLYGCDVAASADGRALVQGLAALTGADVAASTDLTGAASLGGNWQLEYATGAIQAAAAPSVAEAARWLGTMSVYSVTTTADQAGGGLVGSLRWAINQANAHAGADTISFAVSGSFDIAGGSTGDNTNATGDFDITDSLSLVGNGAAATVIHGNGAERVFDVRGGTVAMQDLTVTGGGGNGGGLGLMVRSGAQLQLARVIVSGNVGNGSGGGIASFGSLSLADVEIRDNQTGDGGGGVYVAGAASLSKLTLAGNSAGNGGGLYAAGSVSLSNSTVSGNSAGGFGGGIYSGPGTLTIDHATVAGNAAVSGGGVYQSGLGAGFAMANSIFANSSGGNLSGPFTSQGYNLLSDFSLGFYKATDNYSPNIHLGPLADNGGFTRTQAIDATSDARDWGNPGDTSAFDQRGLARYGRSDIGAFEYIAPNTAPTISAIADQSIDEDTGATVNFTIGDAETPGSLSVSASSGNQAMVSDASLLLSGSGANRNLSFTPVANANSLVAGPVAITITVSDGSDSSTRTFQVTLRPVNDAPVAHDDLASTAAVTLVSVPVLANDTDVDGDALAIDSVTVDPALGIASVQGNTIEFTPGANTQGEVHLHYVVRDPSGALSAAATVTVNVGVNKPPTSTSPTSLGMPEDGSVLLSAADLNYVDPEGDMLGGLRIDALPAQGSLLLNGAPVGLGATISAADLAAGRLRFVPVPDASSSGIYASLQFSVQDALGAYAIAPQHIDFMVAAVNDAPRLDDGRSGNTTPLGYPENATPMPLFVGLVLSDIDSAGLASASVRFDGGAAAAEDSLGFSNDGRTMGNIQAGFDAASGVLTMTSPGGSATLAEWQAALRSVSYSDGSDRPLTAPRGISLQVDDGGSVNALSNSLHTSVAVVPVDDVPVAPPLALGAIDEDSPRSLTSNELLAGASDADGDALVVLGLRVAAGSAAVAANGHGGWSLTPDADWNGTLQLQYEVSDGTASVTRSASLLVAAVDDAPVITLDSLAISEGGSAVPVLQATDVEGDALLYSASQVAHGHFAFVGAPGVASLNFSQADVDAARVRFYSDGGEQAPSYRVSASDGQLASAISEGQVVYTSVDDAPVVGTVRLGSLASGGTRVITPAELLAASSDAENDPLQAGHLVIAVGSGQLAPRADGGWIFTATGTAAGTVTFRFEVSDGQAATAGEAELSVAAAVPAPPVPPPVSPPAEPPAAPPTVLPVAPPIAAPPVAPAPAPGSTPLPSPAASPARVIAALATSPAETPPAPAPPADAAAAEVVAGGASHEAARAPAGALQLPAAAVRDVLASGTAALAPALRLDAAPPAGANTGPAEAPLSTPLRLHRDALAQFALLSEDAHHDAPSRSLVDVAVALRERSLVEALDRLRHAMDSGQRATQEVVAAGAVMSTGLSVGYVLWLARGGALVASLVSALPAWAMVDPLPVLAQMKREVDDEAPDDEVESLFAKARRFARPAPPPSEAAR